MKYSFNWLIPAIGTAVALASAVSGASVLHNESGLVSNFVTQTFDSNSGDESVAGSQFAGLNFGPGNYVSNAYGGAFSNMSNSVISNFTLAGCCATPTYLHFNDPVSEVAFAFVSNPGFSTFTALLGNIEVETFSPFTDFMGDFYGFTDIYFDTIRIEAGGDNNAYILDNLQYHSTVPTPGILELVGIALLGMGMGRLRQPK